MNRTKIDYADYTWNPVVGCRHGCPYCYARRFAERGLGEYGRHEKGSRFFPRFFPERLKEPASIKKPARIFVCSMGDLFGKWVPTEWISAVVQVAEKCPHHTFLFLTKNPARYNEIWWPPNCWIGTTVESSLTASRLVCISKVEAPVRFVSFEPLTGAVAKFDLEALRDVQWVIIGAMTGPGAVKPKPEWVSRIINRARDFNIPVFLKANLGWPEQIREFPKESKFKDGGGNGKFRLVNLS